MTVLLEDVRQLDDTDLLDAYRAADDVAARAILGEAARRDRADRATRARDSVHAEWYDAMHAQRTEAEAYCRGWLLNPEARRLNALAGESGKVAVSEWQLWTGPAWLVDKFASEELLAYFGEHPRLTLAEFRHQRAEAGRIAREEWLERREDGAGDTNEITAEEADTDERYDTSGPGLARDDASAFRHGTAAAQAPQAGSGRAVHGARPGTGPAEDREESSAGAGGPGRPVRPVAREDGDDMGESGTRARTFAETDETDQEWLWPGMIPAGLLTVIFGPPKASKTTLAVDYAARVSRGDVNPDGTSLGPAAPVLMGALEDISESSTIKKLRAAGADLSMVVDVSGGPDGDGLELSLDHVAWLHEVAAEYPGVALIVIDTLSSSATRPTTTRQGLKAMLKPLAALARNTGAAVVLTAHSLKGHDDVPEGGQALVSIPRMVLSVQRSKDEPGVRTLSVYASNVASDQGEGFRYRLAGSGAETRVEWAWDSVRTGPGPEATAQARILLLLKNTPEALPLRLVAARTGISYPVAAVLLSRMKKRSEVIPGGERGTWTVPQPQESLAS